MLFGIKDILIKLFFISFLFIFFFQETTYAKEYAVNDCVAAFSDDWDEKELNNNQSTQHSQLFLVNEERHEMAHIFAFPLSNGLADMSEIEKTEYGRNAFVKERADWLMEFSEYTNAEKIKFSEYRYTNSFGAAYIEYIKKTEKSGRTIYVREYNTIKHSTLYTFSFLYVLEDHFKQGSEYDKQIVNNIKFNENPSTSHKKLQEVNDRLDALLHEDSKAPIKNPSTAQQTSQEDKARLDAFLHGGLGAFIYTAGYIAVFAGIGFLCKKLYK